MGDTNSFIEDRGEYTIYLWIKIARTIDHSIFLTARSYFIHNETFRFEMFVLNAIFINVRSVETFVSIRDF